MCRIESINISKNFILDDTGEEWLKQQLKVMLSILRDCIG